MAVYEHFQNLYDIRLKPRLLRSLIRDRVPDEKHPFSKPSELSIVVSAVKNHGLLSESSREAVDPKHMENWKSSIDAWIERLLLLVSSKMPDKCWAGICLLGLTCQECSSDRFLASYSVWFQKLLAQIQPPSDSHFVKVASCASLADLFTRLSGFSNIKKDVTSHAGKLIQPVLKLLTDDSSGAVWEGAVDLLCSIINFFPSSVHCHYESVEAAIVSKIMSGKCNSNISKKFVHCLALLPRSKGDEDSWSLMLQKILISINVDLNDAFQGLEEETKSNEVIKHLVPPGKEPPPPLGGNKMQGETSNQATEMSEQLILHRISMLMLCCCRMLTNPYPAQVIVPVRPLLVLVGRVLMVDGSLSQSLLPFLTVMQREFICSELPLLHLCGLDLLTAIIKRVRSQLLPHAADVVRLLTEYFRRCALPALRVKVYSILRILLISMGVGMAQYLAQEVVSNALVDLDSIVHGCGEASSTPCSKAASEGFILPSHRKRKHGTITGFSEEQQGGVGTEMEAVKGKPITPIAVQTAALQALEALLTVGGALRSECWRQNVDLLLITVATNASNGGWANEEKDIFLLSDEPTSTRTDFQLAALRALLASLLSPARVRPPYLSRGLELFRRGKQETGTMVAEFCAHALLALEVLIHPRALPLVNFPSGDHPDFGQGFNCKFPKNIFSSGLKNNSPFPRGILGKDETEPESNDDELYSSWLGNDEETEASASIPDKHLESRQELSEKDGRLSTEDHQVEKHPSDLPAGAQFPKEGDRGATDAAHMETGGIKDSIMAQSERVQEIIPNNDVQLQDKDVIAPALSSEINNKVLMAAADANALTSDQGSLLTTSIVTEKGKKLVLEYNSDASKDSFPDIVDGEPDSD